MKKLVLFLLLMLTACSAPLYAGTVTEKVYTPAHKTYAPIVMIVNKTTRVIPRWVNHGDEWLVWIQNGEDRDSWTVSEEYYNSVEVGDYVTSEQLQKTEDTLRKWIKDWEEIVDIYIKYKDSDNPEEQQLADTAKEQANKIADSYNKLLLKYGNMFGETLPEGIYAVIERIE